MNPRYEWEKEYLEAILEPDNKKLCDRIEALQKTLQTRIKLSPSDKEERTAILETSKNLEILWDERCQSVDLSNE